MDASLPPPKARKLHHHTLESASLELLNARERVLELEKLVELLEQEEKQQSTVVPAAPAVPSNDDDMHLALQGAALQIAIGWLGPKDICSCIETCRKWKHDVDQEKVWEQTLRIQSPTLWNTLKAAANPSCCSFKKAVIGSTHKRDDYRFTYRTDEEAHAQHLLYGLPDPSLGPDNLFVLVEVRDIDSNQVIARSNVPFTKKIDGCCQTILVYDNDGSSGGRSVCLPARYDLAVSCRLFRSDTNQSIGISYNMEPFHSNSYIQRNTVQPFAESDAGRRAMNLWNARRYHSVEWQLDLLINRSDDMVPGETRFYFERAFCHLSLYGNYKTPTFREFLVLLDGWKWQ